MRAPDAPIGWPSATAPPFTFTVSGSASSIRVELSATEQNASFTSTRLHVADLLARLVERDLAGARRRPGEVGELVGDVALRDDRREHLEPALLRELLARDDERAGAVVDARRVPGGRRPLGVEDRLQRRQLLERRVAPRALVGRDLADRDDLVREPALVRRRDRALVRAERPLVLRPRA